MEMDVSILVVSCDKYSDLWPIFFALKKKYWPDCAFETYLGTNSSICKEDNVKTLFIGPDVSWADNVRYMLNQIPTDYVLLLLEDFLIDKHIDNEHMTRLVRYMDENNVDCLRLEPRPGPVMTSNKSLHVGKLNCKAPYYVSTQPAIWKKSVLSDLLKRGYSAWDFEERNSAAFKANDMNLSYRFEGLNRFAFHHRNGVERGKWYRSVVRFLNNEGINVDFEKRGVIEDESLIKKIRLQKYHIIIGIKTILAEMNVK